MPKLRRIKRRIRFISEVRILKQYTYVGNNGSHHVFEDRKCVWFVPIRAENINLGRTGEKYSLSKACRRNSVKQYK